MRLFVKTCCAWLLIALALSPFTAPFAVVGLHEVVGHHVASHLPVLPTRRDELQTLLVDGGSLLDLPVVPMARHVKVTALAQLSMLGLVQIAGATMSRPSPAAVTLVGRQPRVAVLRL